MVSKTKTENPHKDVVKVIHTRKHDADVIASFIKESQVGDQIRRCKKIVIKPNLCTYLHPSTGATTDVKAVESVIRALQKTGYSDKEIIVVESDSGAKYANTAFEILDYSRLEENPNVRLMNLSREPYVKLRIDGHFFHEMKIPEILLDEDFIINIPKLKTFDADVITCSLKNSFGLIPTKNKAKYHSHLPQVLYDINVAFRSSLIVVDGIIGMEGFGPSDGVPITTNTLILGTLPASVDYVAARFMGVDPRRAKHISYALEKGGLGSKHILVTGNGWSQKIKFLEPRKPLIRRLLKI